MFGLGLVKYLVVGGALAFLVVEVGRPVVVRAQLDNATHDAADAAGRIMEQGGAANRPEAAKREVEAIIARQGGTLEKFEILSDQRIHIETSQLVNAVVFDEIDSFDSWYLVHVEATSTGSTL